MNEDILSYGKPPVRASRWSIALFAASIAAAFLFFLIVPSLLVLLASLFVRDWAGKREDIAGHRYAAAAITISGLSIFLGLGALLLLPSIGSNRRGHSLGTCLANTRGIVQSMNVYAASEGDAYPVVAYASYTSACNLPNGTPALKSVDDTVAAYYRPPFPQAGKVQACVWILAAQESVSTKQFLCKYDSRAGVPAQTTDAGGKCFDNFQRGDQLSYSFAYPWKADGTVGPWWKSTSDAEIPIAADMAPMQGTGTPARNLVPGVRPVDPRTWNSGNHQGQGQVVAFGDAHSEFLRSPDVGQASDNIYSMSGSPSTGPAQCTGIPAGKAAPALTADKPPYDIVMFPVRNETTGGF